MLRGDHPMSTVRIRSAFLAAFCALLAALFVSFCAPRVVDAQIKTNLSSSVTSEAMTDSN
jgi:hypothetical protein